MPTYFVINLASTKNYVSQFNIYWLHYPTRVRNERLSSLIWKTNLVKCSQLQSNRPITINSFKFGTTMSFTGSWDSWLNVNIENGEWLSRYI